MADVVIVEFCGEPLALSREQFEAARMLARSLIATPAEAVRADAADRLVDAEALATLTSLPQSWLEEQARRETIPSLQLGKYRRFHVADALTAIRKLGRTG